MAGVNKVILVGYLGKDPEIRNLEVGLIRASFSMATTEVHKDKNGNKIEHTEWHNILLWRGLAENAEKLLKKGSMIYLEGKLQTRDWMDKEGRKHYITEIVGDSFQLLDRKEHSGNQNNPQHIDPPKMTDINGGSSDLPF
ncbi:MAG: single-stranded DNA-binding protein [Bacteroidota bacterium]|nr:single-stranded DNA-binding protein [Bacteroidota bacterium]